jgi:hypothetical protein
LVAVFLTCGATDRVTSSQPGDVSPVRHVDHYILDEELSSYALLWSYLDAFVAWTEDQYAACDRCP